MAMELKGITTEQVKSESGSVVQAGSWPNDTKKKQLSGKKRLKCLPTKGFDRFKVGA